MTRPTLTTFAVAVLTASPLFASGRSSGGAPGRSVPSVRALQLKCERQYEKGPHTKLDGWVELHAFLKTLLRNRAALRAVMKYDMPGATHAAMLHTTAVGPVEGLRFARTLKPGTRVWTQVVWTLSFDGGEPIRSYVRGMARSRRSDLRGFAYSIGLCRKWGDMVQAARGDLDSDALIKRGRAFETLGDLAREYLDRFERPTPLPR